MPLIQVLNGDHRDEGADSWQAIVMAGFLALIVACAVPDLCAQTALGDRFVLNAGFPTGEHLRPAVAAVDDGFVAVWSGEIASQAGYGSIEGRRFRPDGSFLGDQFQVNSLLVTGHDLPDVAALAGGGFMVVWTSAGSGQDDNGTTSVQARRFASDGTPNAAQFQVNSFTTGDQLAPGIAGTSTGGFIVAWNSEASDGDASGRSIRARRFDAGDNPLGAEFQVNTYTTGEQLYPMVTSSRADDFIVVWHSDGSSGGDTSNHSVQARRFTSDGTPIAGEFQVNTYTSYFQAYASVASADDGGFVIVWQSEGSTGTDNGSSSIQARIFHSDGTSSGAEFQVNNFTPGGQRLPEIHRFPPGDFVVAWRDGDPYFGLVSARQFFADGAPVADQVEVSFPQAFGPRSRLRVAGSASEFVVAWDDYDYPPPTDVSARGFRSALSIFADGFESGDTSAWN